MRNGQITMTMPGVSGDPVVYIGWFFDPDTLVLRENPSDWTDPAGTVWPAGTGALIAVNRLDQDVQMAAYDGGGVVARRVLMPARSSFSATAEQLQAALPPDGPYRLSTDLNGMSFDLSTAG